MTFNNARSFSKNNKGYSLVEIIVVMGIMTILVGIMSIGISLMFSRDAQSVAVMIDDQLTETRMLSMTKAGEFAITVHAQSPRDNYILITQDGAEYRKIMLDKRDVEIEFSGGNDATIIFNKANGSVKTVGGADASGIYTYTVKGLRGAHKEQIVTLVSTTGRHFTDK